MLERIFELRQVINAMNASDSFKIVLDFDVLEKIIDVLQPFDIFTKELSLRTASISSILPVYYLLRNLLSVDNDSELLKVFKET